MVWVFMLFQRNIFPKKKNNDRYILDKHAEFYKVSICFEGLIDDYFSTCADTVYYNVADSYVTYTKILEGNYLIKKKLKLKGRGLYDLDEFKISFDNHDTIPIFMSSNFLLVGIDDVVCN